MKFTVKAEYFLLVAVRMLNDCTQSNGVWIQLLSYWSSSKLVSSPKISSSFPLISPFSQNLPLDFFNSFTIYWICWYIDSKLAEWLENLFSLQHWLLIWMQVDAMYWLTNLQHLFIPYCLKLNDRSAESISQFWSNDREWIKEEAVWS